MSHTFDKLRLPELQKYLRDRGVTVTGYNKVVLKEIAVAVERLQLPEDPDFQQDSVENCILKKLSKAGLPHFNPLEIDGYSSDFTQIPEFGLIDIFNYMIFSRTDYDGKKLKGYKSFEDYRLFYDGHVESLLFNPLDVNSTNCLFKAKVKPTQRDKTRLNKTFYELWFVLDKEDGYAITAHCECIGGADGACRHIAAALYELEAFEKKSCTEGENQWLKRPRHHNVPVPIRHLSVVKGSYGQQMKVDVTKPHVDLYDPRHETQRQQITEEKKREFGLKLLEVCPSIQALDTILQPVDRQKESEPTVIVNLKKLSIMEKAKTFLESHAISEDNIDEMCTLFLNQFTYTSEQISDIFRNTEGQSSNEIWYFMRKGMLTASVFEKACNYIDKEKEPSLTYMNNIFGLNSLDDKNLPPPLKWGRRKEPIARLMYQRIKKRQHIKHKTEERGLLISSQHPFLGCSVDGEASCKCRLAHAPRLVEIKCPYASKDMFPKEVAVEKKCYYNSESKQWEVGNDSPYYCQIQGQLGIFQYKQCDLVIYTRHGIHISTVEFNPQYFMEMVKKLEVFHRRYILPQILNQL